MEVRELELVKEPKAGIALADFSLKYELDLSIGDFEYDKSVVEKHFTIVAKLISINLTREIGADLFIGNIEYSEGSVNVNGYVFAAHAFVTSILAGYIVNQLPDVETVFEAVISAPAESQKEYEEICKKIESVTTITIENYEKNKRLKSTETTITTTTIENVCEEWIDSHTS
ncbi:MAG: hypothetical protein COA59_05980 [Colwellia sp.]|nr:MAG: hypothetical protein COA59_05980 [Colwellia sp.]